MDNTRLKGIWTHMKRRCYNPNSGSYPNYGGRGISVCEEWLNSYEAFEEWALANGYEDGLSIDRINVNGNYEPANCRWADSKVQRNNKRHYWLPQNQEDFVYNGSPDSADMERKCVEIKTRLSRYHLTQVWLINQLAMRDLRTDKTEMSSLLSGSRVGAKAEYIVNLSLEILDWYHETFVGVLC